MSPLSAMCSINYQGASSGISNEYVGNPTNTNCTFYGDSSKDPLKGANINIMIVGI